MVLEGSKVALSRIRREGFRLCYLAAFPSSHPLLTPSPLVSRRDLPQYRRKQWQSYFGRTFDVYTKLWKFQQQHRSAYH